MHEIHVISTATIFLETLRKRASAVAVAKYYLEEAKVGGDAVEVTLNGEKQRLSGSGDVISVRNVLAS